VNNNPHGPAVNKLELTLSLVSVKGPGDEVVKLSHLARKDKASYKLTVIGSWFFILMLVFSNI
jgi:hypothetical protein